MLLPPGAEKATSPTTEPPAEEEQVQEELAPEPEPEPAPAPPVLDLLGFDEAASHIAPGEGEAAAPEGNAQDAAPAPPPSALDLLSELDFGALSIGPPPPPAQGNGQHPGANGGSTSAAQSAPGYWTSGGIPDAFVLHAASDVYGLPPAAGTPPQPHQQTSGYGHAQPGYYQQSQALVPVSPGPYGQPAPWGMQPQQAQQQQFYPSHQSGGGMALTPPGMPLASPGASPQFVYGMQGAVPAAASPWTASAPTPTGQRDPELFRQAGAHDPFISLTGVQQGQGGGAMKPSPR